MSSLEMVRVVVSISIVLIQSKKTSQRKIFPVSKSQYELEFVFTNVDSGDPTGSTAYRRA